MLLSIVLGASTKYRVTQVIWHQGETDYNIHTSAKVYVSSFNSLIETLNSVGIDAPVYISVSTKCGNQFGWRPDNQIAAAQKTLIDNKRIFLGADTDALLGQNDRRIDECHFSSSGQEKVATSYFKAMIESIKGK